jgi:hypothetical protein
MTGSTERWNLTRDPGPWGRFWPGILGRLEKSHHGRSFNVHSLDGPRQPDQQKRKPPRPRPRGIRGLQSLKRDYPPLRRAFVVWASGPHPTWIKSRKIIFRNFTIVSRDLERRCAYGGNEGRGERCTFRTLEKGSEVPSLYVRNVSAALGRFGSGANPLQPLPASSPRSLARLKKGRSDAHHRNGQGEKIITYSRPQGGASIAI